MKNFKLSKERKQSLINQIQEFFITERDEEIGELAASIILDFILDKIAPEIYNQGIGDAYNYMCERTEDLLSLTK